MTGGQGRAAEGRGHGHPLWAGPGCSSSAWGLESTLWPHLGKAAKLTPASPTSWQSTCKSPWQKADRGRDPAPHAQGTAELLLGYRTLSCLGDEELQRVDDAPAQRESKSSGWTHKGRRLEGWEALSHYCRGFMEEDTEQLGKQCKEELGMSILDGGSGLQAGPEVEKGMVLTSRDWFCPIGLEGKEWAGQQVGGVYPNRREEAGSELHPVLTGESPAMEWGGRGR